MKIPVFILVLGCLSVSMVLTSCSESSAEPAITVTGLTAYSGSFECDDLDGDTAVLLFDHQSDSGWFGWVPSNGGVGTYVMRPIEGLSFTVTFSEVYGADKQGVVETLTFKFSGTLNEEKDEISGTGTVTRGDESEEPCTFSFSPTASI